LRSIQLNHGDSDKPASASRQFRAYDRNLVAGQAAVDRFAHYGVEMPRELVRIVGRPQVEAVERPAQAPQDALTVLYAPTWAGYFTDSNLSSLPYGADMVQDLLDRGCTIVFRPHAFTSRSPELQTQADRIRALLAEDSSATGRAHLYGPAAETEMTVVECFNASDAMVADVSSIVSDYLYSEKPFAMASAGMPRAEFTAAYPVSQAAYVVDPDRTSFHAAFDAMFGDDPLRAERAGLRRYYLGDFPAEGYSDVFVQALRDELTAATTR
jgi:CDP-glycerol glycerophosphotransferase (TagB/SpsB family)